MAKFKVSVEKVCRQTGAIEVDAADAAQAIGAVQIMISKGKLQTTEIEWDDPEYVDDSFTTTGDVD
jgi:hypothetical protein